MPTNQASTTHLCYRLPDGTYYADFSCSLSTFIDQFSHARWILDITKYVVNDPDRTKCCAAIATSQLRCIRFSPVLIKQLHTWGLPVEKACDLVADAVGGSKVVQNEPQLAKETE